MSFQDAIRAHRPNRVSDLNVTEGDYQAEDLEEINQVFQFCEEIEADNQTVRAFQGPGGEINEVLLVSDEVREAVLDGLAGARWTLSRFAETRAADSVAEIYQWVGENRYLPANKGTVMATMLDFRRNLAQRTLGSGMGNAGLWDDLQGSMEDVLEDTDTALNAVAVPALSHGAGTLSGFFSDTPEPTVNRRLLSFRPSSVQPHFSRVRGQIATRVVGSTNVLRNLERVTCWSSLATKFHTCFNLAQACISFPETSETWRNTLQQFREDPTEENLMAYGVSAGHMVQDISNMLNNPPLNPTGGSIPFYGSLFRHIDDFTENAVRVLGRGIFRTDRRLREIAERAGIDWDSSDPRDRGVRRRDRD